MRSSCGVLLFILRWLRVGFQGWFLWLRNLAAGAAYASWTTLLYGTRLDQVAGLYFKSSHNDVDQRPCNNSLFSPSLCPVHSHNQRINRETSPFHYVHHHHRTAATFFPLTTKSSSGEQSGQGEEPRCCPFDDPYPSQHVSTPTATQLT